MALAGTLKDFSLADIFQLIGLQRKTGTLTLTAEKEEACIFFLNGMIVGAELRDEGFESRLGHVLVKTNHITSDELERALTIQKQTLQQLGQVLIAQNFITKEDLRASLNTQVCEIVYRLFRWKDGEYHFAPKEHVDYDEELVTPIGSESLLMEGIRMVDEWPMIEKVIPSFDILVERTDAGEAANAELMAPLDLGESMDGGGDSFFGDEPVRKIMVDLDGEPRKLKIAREQETILKMVDGPKMVAEIRDVSRFNEFETCRALYDLIEMGLVKPVTTDSFDSEYKVIEEKHSLPIWLPLSLVGLAALVSFFMAWNPLNAMLPSFQSMPDQGSDFQAETQYRLNQLARAVDTYYIANERLPSALETLINEGLVHPNLTKAPDGTRFSYDAKNSTATYEIKSQSLNGRNGGEISVTRTFDFQE